jgi:hypothetical protein
MTTKISNIVNRQSARWIVVVVFMVAAVFGATGIAAATDGTKTTYYNETTPITNDTTDLNVTINGSGGSDVYVNFYRIADDSESTETLESENVILNGWTNASLPVETNNTAAYRVVVHDNNDQYHPTASDLGNITVTQLPPGSGEIDSGGNVSDGDPLGGGSLGSGGGLDDGTMLRIIAAIAIVAGIRYL